MKCSASPECSAGSIPDVIAICLTDKLLVLQTYRIHCRAEKRYQKPLYIPIEQSNGLSSTPYVVNPFTERTARS